MLCSVSLSILVKQSYQIYFSEIYSHDTLIVTFIGNCLAPYLWWSIFKEFSNHLFSSITQIKILVSRTVRMYLVLNSNVMM